MSENCANAEVVFCQVAESVAYRGASMFSVSPRAVKLFPWCGCANTGQFVHREPGDHYWHEGCVKQATAKNGA